MIDPVAVGGIFTDPKTESPVLLCGFCLVHLADGPDKAAHLRLAHGAEVTSDGVLWRYQVTAVPSGQGPRGRYWRAVV